MALGKNIKAKSTLVEKKEKVAKPATRKKIEKKELISKPPSKPKAKKNKEDSSAKIFNYISEENLKHKAELRSKYLKELSQLKGKEAQFVIFKIGTEEFAVEIDKIKEVVATSRIAKIPNTPKHVIGATNVRGVTLMAIDLEHKFEIDSVPDYKYSVSLKNSQYKIALLMRELPITLKVSGDNITGSLEGLEFSVQDKTYIKGIIELENRLIFYIDIDELIESDKAIVVPKEILNKK